MALTAREKVAAYIKKAAISVSQGHDTEGFVMLVTMNGREYALRGDDAENFRRDYAAIQKPEAPVHALVEKYMDKMRPYKTGGWRKSAAPAAPGVAPDFAVGDEARAWQGAQWLKGEVTDIDSANQTATVSNGRRTLTVPWGKIELEEAHSQKVRQDLDDQKRRDQQEQENAARRFEEQMKGREVLDPQGTMDALASYLETTGNYSLTLDIDPNEYDQFDVEYQELAGEELNPDCVKIRSKAEGRGQIGGWILKFPYTEEVRNYIPVPLAYKPGKTTREGQALLSNDGKTVTIAYNKVVKDLIQRGLRTQCGQGYTQMHASSEMWEHESALDEFNSELEHLASEIFDSGVTIPKGAGETETINDIAKAAVERGNKAMKTAGKKAAMNEDAVQVFDNGGETADRYTIVFMGTAHEGMGGGELYDAVAASDDVTSPQGFYQHTEAALGNDPQAHLGKRIAFEKLPQPLQARIQQELDEMNGVKEGAVTSGMSDIDGVPVLAAGGEYGVRWQEFTGRDQRLKTKEKFFATAEARARFLERVQASGNFYEIVAYSDPRQNPEALGGGTYDFVHSGSAKTATEYSQEARRVGDRAMEIDNEVWDELGIKSGTQLYANPELWGRYRQEWKQILLGERGVGLEITPEVLHYLEGHNFHSAVKVLMKLGYKAAKLAFHSQGRECDNCETPLGDDDFSAPGSWSYTCPSCGFRYNHGGDLRAQLKKFEANGGEIVGDRAWSMIHEGSKKAATGWGTFVCPCGAKIPVAKMQDVYDHINNEHNSPQTPVAERLKIEEAMRKFEDEIRGRGYKSAGFNFYFPGQVLREFYPEIQHEIVDYPNANNSPMIEDIDIVTAAVEDALNTSKLAFVSTSPAGGALGRDGKPEVLEGAPLRKENDIRGPMFTDEFYQNYEAGPEGDALEIVSHKTAAAEEAAQFAKFLKKVMGEIAAAMVSAFKVTSRPLMDKVPGVGEVQLAQVEKTAPGFMPIDASVVDPASRVKYLLEKLTDSEIQDAINEAWAQAAVWHDQSEGGFVYEVFARAESIDTDTMVMKYEFVIGTREAQ